MHHAGWFLPGALLVALLMPARPVVAQAGHGIAVTQAWARATPPGASVGGAYFTIVNDGDADVLLRVESPVSRKAEVHLMQMKDGMMSMRPMPTVAIPAHGRVVFSPEGLHVMLVDLHQPLRQGEHVPLTLVFRKAGPVQVQAITGGLGDEGPAVAADHGGHH